MSYAPQIEQALAELAQFGEAARRSAEGSLAPILRHGDAVAQTWLQAARRLYSHDPDG